MQRVSWWGLAVQRQVAQQVDREVGVAKADHGKHLLWFTVNLQGRRLPFVVVLLHVAVQNLAFVPLLWLVVML